MSGSPSLEPGGGRCCPGAWKGARRHLSPWRKALLGARSPSLLVCVGEDGAATWHQVLPRNGPCHSLRRKGTDEKHWQLWSRSWSVPKSAGCKSGGVCSSMKACELDPQRKPASLQVQRREKIQSQLKAVRRRKSPPSQGRVASLFSGLPSNTMGPTCPQASACWRGLSASLTQTGSSVSHPDTPRTVLDPLFGHALAWSG